jgi:lysophospholipase L1-like esterase
LIGIGAAIVILITWLLWPSPFARVTNLGSTGSSVIAFGDSLTAGYGAGRSGDTTESALARIDRDVLAAKPRLVIVGLGGNDYLGGTAIQTTEANLRTIVHNIQGTGAMVVLLGFRFPSLNANYEAMYERVADEEGCFFINRTLKGILTDPKLRSDAIHPNARGYELMAERMSGPLKKLMAKADRAK